MLIKRIVFENIFFTLLMILFLFNIKFKGLPPTAFIAFSILSIMAFFYAIKGYRYPGVLLRPMFFYIVFIVSVCSSAIYNSRVDLFLSGVLIAILFSITVAPYALLSYFKGKEIEVLRYVVYAGVVNAFFIIGMFLSSSFRDFYLSLLSSVDLLKMKGEDVADGLYAMRLTGLTGSSTSGMAALQTIICFVYIAYLKIRDLKPSVRSFLIVGVLFVSALLSGRTAFAGMALFAIYFSILYNLRQFARLILLFTVLFIFFLFIAKTLLPYEFYNYFHGWLAEISKIGSGEINSVEVNKGMLAAYSLNDFSFFGDFKWHSDQFRNSYYMDTDVGYYRVLFAFGYFGLFAIMMFILSFVKFDMRINKVDLTTLFIVLYLIALMFKGAILFNVLGVYIVLTLLFFMSSKRRVLRADPVSDYHVSKILQTEGKNS